MKQVAKKPAPKVKTITMAESGIPPSWISAAAQHSPFHGQHLPQLSVLKCPHLHWPCRQIKSPSASGLTPMPSFLAKKYDSTRPGTRSTSTIVRAPLAHLEPLQRRCALYPHGPSSPHSPNALISHPWMPACRQGHSSSPSITPLKKSWTLPQALLASWEAAAAAAVDHRSSSFLLLPCPNCPLEVPSLVLRH